MLLKLPPFLNRLNELVAFGCARTWSDCAHPRRCPEVNRTLMLTENLHRLKRCEPAVTWLGRSWVCVAKQQQNLV